MPSYSGVFTLQAQMQAIVAGLWPINGPYPYVEDVFSTYLYTANGATGQTITNGIDLSGSGGMVWAKDRTVAYQHVVWDTARGTNVILNTDGTNANTSKPASITYNNNGFRLNTAEGNETSDPTVSWTFRKQPKFFDIVTYTGTGSNTTIAHNLGSVPGCIIVKRTDTPEDWQVYHRSLANTEYLVLNTTAAKATGANRWNSTTPTSRVFSLGSATTVNASGGTYVAYIYAHDAGGFGLLGTDNVISCSSFTTDGSGNAVVNLGYEPQWLMVKNATTASNNEWRMVDNMRGFPVDGASSSVLTANTSAAEFTSGTINVLNTGFQIDGLANSATFIYIAIRRGPMKTPTVGTSVFSPVTRTGTGAATTSTAGFPVDWSFIKTRTVSGQSYQATRLTANAYLQATNTNAETTIASTYPTTVFQSNTLVNLGSTDVNDSGRTYVDWFFCRAPGFFDVVCYTGTGGATTVTHNLGVVPELMIIKWRDGIQNWYAYSQPVGNERTLFLNSTSEQSSTSVGYWNNTTPTASVFSVGAGPNVLSRTYVAYLFASCPGVSKVGSYTGTGATLSINAGFTTGARFVMIKRTDSTGSWFIWDTARGMVAGTDPKVAANDAAAESNANWVYTASSGFQIVTTDASVNASGGSYIYLAIA